MPFRAHPLVGVQGNCSVLGASVLTSTVPALPAKRAPQRDVDITRAEHDALDLQSHKIAVAEFLQQGRLACGNLPIDFLNLMLKRGDYQFLDVRSRDAGDAARSVLALLQHRLRDVVAIAYALLVGVARAHQVAAIIIEKAREERRRARLPHLASARSMLEFRLHGLFFVETVGTGQTARMRPAYFWSLPEGGVFRGR
jgi:hypothetical protein